MIEIMRADELSSFFFSKAKPLHSPWLVYLNFFNFDQKRCNTWKGFRALPSLLSFTSFCSDSQLYVVGFSKAIALLGLAGYKMIITNSILRGSLFLIAYPACLRRIIMIYIEVCVIHPRFDL